MVHLLANASYASDKILQPFWKGSKKVLTDFKRGFELSITADFLWMQVKKFSFFDFSVVEIVILVDIHNC